MITITYETTDALRWRECRTAGELQDAIFDLIAMVEAHEPLVRFEVEWDGGRDAVGGVDHVAPVGSGENPIANALGIGSLHKKVWKINDIQYVYTPACPGHYAEQLTSQRVWNRDGAWLGAGRLRYLTESQVRILAQSNAFQRVKAEVLS